MKLVFLSLQPVSGAGLFLVAAGASSPPGKAEKDASLPPLSSDSS